MPEWGGHVHVREMTAYDRDKFDSQLAENMDLRRARAFILCVCDENGQPLFTDQDLKAVQAMPAAQVERCCDVIWRLSGMFGRGEGGAEKNSSGPHAG